MRMIIIMAAILAVASLTAIAQPTPGRWALVSQGGQSMGDLIVDAPSGARHFPSGPSGPVSHLDTSYDAITQFYKLTYYWPGGALAGEAEYWWDEVMECWVCNSVVGAMPWVAIPGHFFVWWP